MKIRGYRTGQKSGPCLVTVMDGVGDERVLVRPTLTRAEFDHSPDGFQWGYLGSGPAELARAILVRVMNGDNRARHPRCYQAFKSEVIGRITKDEFEIDFRVIREWFATWVAKHPEVEAGWL